MKKVKILNPKDVLRIVKANVVNVPVPEWGASVPCQIPDYKVLLQMKVEAANNEEYNEALFKKVLIGFNDDDLQAMSEGNGLRYLQLQRAVMNSADLFAAALETGNIKN